MIKTTTLPNGLRIITENIPFVRSVAFGIWVRAGSRNETPQNHGISHFTEHMLFKGTEKRTAMEIADTMDTLGGQLNAFTSKEYTCYFARTLDTHFDVALDVLSDMFFNSKFDRSDIEKERGVIFEELNMYEDTPEDIVADLLQYKCFPQNPVGLPVLGTAETISAFGEKQFRDYMAVQYRPENVVLAIAGNINEQEVLEKLTAAFGSYKGSDTQGFDKPAVYTPGFSLRERDIEQVHLCMGFPGIKHGIDEGYALAAVNTILGGGMSSRLFQKIREEHGLVYSVYSYNMGFYDTGIFVIYAALKPENVYDALNLISSEVRGIFTDRITEKQLIGAKEQLKSNFLLSLENTSSRMNSIGRTLLMLDHIITPDDLIEKIDKVTIESCYQVSEKIFDMNNISLSLVGKKAESFEQNKMLNSML